jgi:hypothetical protein
MSLTRRRLITAGAAGLGTAAFGAAWTRPALAANLGGGLPPELLRRALAALNRHGSAIACRDVIGIADFSRPSREARFHLVNIADGRVNSYLVAHGRGSDPHHTGWLERFSNGYGSNATSAGAYRTDGYYMGGHGRSIRLSGLDDTNNNALKRGIVVHGAWYVNPGMASTRGVLGRSEGCFAFAEVTLGEIMARLGPGHLIYADNKISPTILASARRTS